MTRSTLSSQFDPETCTGAVLHCPCGKEFRRKYVAVDFLNDARAEHETLRAICTHLIAAYDHEESEDGFPFSFELRDAHRALCRHINQKNQLGSPPPAQEA